MTPASDGHTAYIALGSNLGDRAATLRAALARLDETDGVRVVRASAFHETAPVVPDGASAGDGGGPYLNAAAELRTTLSPHALLLALLAVERRFGRDRSSGRRWAARTLDLDLLLFADRMLRTPDLTLPHPRMHERAFVLAPLAEIAPDVLIPGVGLTVAAALAALKTGAPRP